MRNVSEIIIIKSTKAAIADINEIYGYISLLKGRNDEDIQGLLSNVDLIIIGLFLDKVNKLGENIELLLDSSIMTNDMRYELRTYAEVYEKNKNGKILALKELLKRRTVGPYRLRDRLVLVSKVKAPMLRKKVAAMKFMKENIEVFKTINDIVVKESQEKE